MKEIVVISGKGGTGKTSVLASFAALAGGAVLADCDVDAADLHLLLAPAIRRREPFRCGHEAVVRQDACVRCGACLSRCRFDAIRVGRGADGAAVFRVDPGACEGCGVCVSQCPAKAIDFPERESGEWYVSGTRHGTMVHARLRPGGENSGKLVSRVRAEARLAAEAEGVGLVLADGPPGVGCPVIASLAGASLALAVTEPTVSGAHDLRRVLELAAHFQVPAGVCVNKWDLNPSATEGIEAEARAAGAFLAGRVRLDQSVTRAQLEGKAVVERPDAEAGRDVRAVWDAVRAQAGIA